LQNGRVNKPLHWDDLRYLLEVGRSGSYGSAADVLGVNGTTVSRRVAALEDSLGARLLTRGKGGLELTGVGRDVAREAERMEQLATAAAGQATGQDARLRGTVRLTVGDALGTRFLAPRLPALLERHPQLELELIVEARILDLTRGEADIGLRMAPPKQAALASRRIGEVATGLYASVGYLERHGAPVVGGTQQHLVISRGARGAALQEEIWLRDNAPRGARTTFVSYSTAAQLAAASAGVGLAALPCFWADAVPELQRVWPERSLIRDMFLVIRRDVRSAARARAVVGFISELFAKHRALLRGELARPAAD
jgi:DNA-binding transcriptional LysR family regulator